MQNKWIKRNKTKRKKVKKPTKTTKEKKKTISGSTYCLFESVAACVCTNQCQCVYELCLKI